MADSRRTTDRSPVIRTPDQRLRVFVSSTLGELSAERTAVRRAVEGLRLSPVMFEIGARPYPPRELYRAYLDQSHVFIGIYAESYGWVAPGEEVSGLEDEYSLAGRLPRLIYIKEPAPNREPRLRDLLGRIKSDDRTSYKRFTAADELGDLVENDLAVLLAERFEASALPAVHRASQAASRPPTPLTETVGREADIAVVADLVESGRLLTLTGPGGVGKTRLALEVTRRVDRSFPGGAHFVALAAVTEPAIVLHTIADRLDVAVEGTRGPDDAIADRIGRARTLLVLDNLEQVAAVGRDLASLLERCPELHVLATSRQALRVRGEREWPVAPLPLPDPGLSLADLEGQPAVRLFTERARDVAPGFRVGPHNASSVIELCRRLDGLPLAIELAAARIRLLSPRSLLERLDARFDALGIGGPDVPQRQRTLRATIDWSHDLLNPSEQALFARLGVFVGGFSVSAAESVGSADDQTDVLETLTSLHDKSLIVTTDGAVAGEPRFHLLETVRAYAWEQLQRRDETVLVRRRHLDWYAELADRAQPYLCGPGQREWAARFDPERANLRVAARTALEIGADDAVIELVWDVIVFYFIRDAVHEPESWMRQVADAGRPLTEVLRAKLDSLLTLMRIHRGEYDNARESLSSALHVFRAHEMTFESAVALKELAWVRYLVDDDTEAAVSALEESTRLFESIDHDWGVALSEIQLGSVFSAIGRLDRAETCFQRSLDHSERIDSWPLMAQALQQLGVLRILDHRPADATPLVERSATLLRQGRHATEATSCLDALAGIALARGELELAERALAVADATRRTLGVSLWPSAHVFVAHVTERVRHGLGSEKVAAVGAAATQLDVFETLEQTLNAMPADA